MEDWNELLSVCFFGNLRAAFCGLRGEHPGSLGSRGEHKTGIYALFHDCFLTQNSSYFD